ncbi:TIM barrel protein [Hahella ganghwensis]|uniref:TIM barrel protein n=1 Tax=Hahella ganghwensis TaxID=286420 RepID=UPI00036B4B37|nr:TIM barrel protein [Hahella ganghwensis]
MSQLSVNFALNHMTCPQMSAEELIGSAARLGIKAVELRNDLGENSLTERSRARSIAELAKQKGIEILSINALYPFNLWNEERAEQAEKLAMLAAACGARGLVLCPLVDAHFSASDEEKSIGLTKALKALNAILAAHQLKGFVEPLGFPASSLRTKRQVVDTIKERSLENRFLLVHDTFHHQGAGENEVFATHTGLVHISGVEDEAIGFSDMQDAHRLLVGPKDRLNTVGQIRQLLSSGYDQFISFESFAKEIRDLDDPMAAVEQSIRYIQQKIAG